LKIYPMIARKDGKMRIGKGFSKSELKEAGVDFKQALRLTVPIDLRRKTRHEENVNVLKQHLGLKVQKIKPPKPSKEPPKPVKTEVTGPKSAKLKKPTKRKKTTEISKPSKRAKTPKAEKPTPKKSAARRKAARTKSAEKT